MRPWSATAWRMSYLSCWSQVADVGDGWWVGQQGEDLVGDVAFEAANRFAFEFALGGLLRDVGLGAGVHRHPDQGDGVDRAVRSAVAAAVEPVPVGLAAGRRDRADLHGSVAGLLGVGRSSSDRATAAVIASEQ